MLRTQGPNPAGQRLGRDLLERRAAQGVQVDAQTVRGAGDNASASSGQDSDVEWAAALSGLPDDLAWHWVDGL